MPTTRKCRGCGADVPANAPFGHCPKCLLDLGFGPLPEDTEPPSAAGAGSDRSFGEYELLEQIGRGGMGIVYKARQVALNRLVAIKMVNAGEFASPILIQRFHREAEAAANLHHPNIVPIYETGEHQGQHFFSMELIEGTGLDRHIGRAGFSSGEPEGDARLILRARQEQIARILAKVAQAVDYAHQRGVLHRDLKPSNVILDRAGEPHLTDFGVAKVLGVDASSLTASGAIMGTPSYMAPEQAAGQSKRITTSADVYSLGAILYAMLTGQPPFRGETPVETLRQVIEQDPKHPSTFKDGMDCDLGTIAMKCLEKEPQRRYPSAAALAEDLERWSRKEPIQARPTHTTERVWRWCRRNPRVAALSGAVAVLLILLSIGSIIVAVVLAGHRSVIRQEVTQNLVDVYDQRQPSYDVSSPMRRALTSGILAALRRAVSGRGSQTASAQNLEFTFVLSPYQHPTNMLETFSPILNALEDNLSNLQGRPVAIKLRMFSKDAGRNDALQSEELTIGRVGPASYIEMLERGGGIGLLAMQDPETPMALAIFTHKDSEVAKRYRANTNTPLAELLKNTSFAFGGSNSTTGYHVACWYLVEKGIYARNLATVTNYAGQPRVIEAVKARTSDAGAGNLDLVDDNPDLLVIARYPLPGHLGLCWVASAKMDSNISEQLKDCLLKMKDQAILGKLEAEVRGFKIPDAKAIEWIRGEANRKRKPFFE